MFGMMEAMLSFLRRQVGLRTDSASASGSLHAKVKEARDTIYSYLVNTITPKITSWHSKQPQYFSYYTPDTSNRTILDITGSGFITGISCRASESVDPRVNIKVTLDGVLRFNSFVEQHEGGQYFVAGEGNSNALSMLHRFNSNLKVEAGNGRSLIFISYVLD